MTSANEFLESSQRLPLLHGVHAEVFLFLHLIQYFICFSPAYNNIKAPIENIIKTNG